MKKRKAFVEDFNLSNKINKELRSKIESFLYHLLETNFHFDAMCWALAELQLIFENSHGNYSEQEVSRREAIIFDLLYSMKMYVG